jgi:hypothetical protein
MDEQVLYYLKGREGTIYFTKKGIVYDLVKRQNSEDRSQESEAGTQNIVSEKAGTPLARAQKKQKYSRLSFTLKPQGANENVQPIPQDELPGKINSFIGNEPQNWQINISTYKSVVYKDLYRALT